MVTKDDAQMQFTQIDRRTKCTNIDILPTFVSTPDFGL